MLLLPELRRPSLRHCSRGARYRPFAIALFRQQAERPWFGRHVLTKNSCRPSHLLSQWCEMKQTVPVMIGLTLACCLIQAEQSACAAGHPVSQIPPLKVQRYARYVVERYDANDNGSLDSSDWQNLPGEVQRADVNGDGVITSEELAGHIHEYGRRRSIRLSVASSEQPAETEQPSSTTERATREATEPISETAGSPRASEESLTDGDSTLTKEPISKRSPPGPSREKKSSRGSPRSKTRFYVPSTYLPKSLPSWFRTKDLDGDGQIGLKEYSPGLSPTEVQQFRRYDANGDGVIAPNELVRTAGRLGATTSESPTPAPRLPVSSPDVAQTQAAAVSSDPTIPPENASSDGSRAAASKSAAAAAKQSRLLDKKLKKLTGPSTNRSVKNSKSGKPPKRSTARP